ncbi:IS66 family transposase [Gemmata sp.]|uniref:IS66 family transposase n=1 Tax=Gemmata sp. TaxID=1914242 RepID=UPI003F71905A
MEDPPSPPLPTDVATLQGMVRELLGTVADLRKTVEAQQLRINDLTRRLYGKKSERVTGENPAPGEVPPAAPPTDPPRRRGHGRRPLPGHLPRERVVFDLTEAEKACPCCGRMRARIGAETSEQLDYRPASLFVVERVRHTYACATCSRTADPADQPTPTITTAPLPAQPIDKGLPGPGLLAHVAVSKFADHLPLHRQAGILARHGVDLSRSTLGGWVAAAAGLLKPLVDRMAGLVRRSRVIQTDDTPVPVLAPGSRRTKTGHLWVYLGDSDHPYVVFDFTPTYSGDGPRAWLGDYAGYVQADALRQYDPLFDRPPPRPAEVGCWAHARRKFHDARATDPARAHEAIARIRRLYDVEAEIRPLDDAGRLAARRSHARPVLDDLFAWLEEQRGRVLPKSPTGVAIGYALGNRAALVRYTEAGGLQIDNNASERALRAVAVGRKNYLFAGSDAGGRSAAVLYSVVGTCRRLGLDPLAYLRDLFTRLRSVPADRLDDLHPPGRPTGR